MKITVQAGAVELTDTKEQILSEEYNNLQKHLQGQENVELYSANRQQAERYYEKIKEEKEYPLSIRRDLIDIQPCSSHLADYFVNIPVAGRYGGVNVPVKTHKEIPKEAELCESKLYRDNGRFYINIVISCEEPETQQANGVLGIDLGLRNPVTGVVLSVAGQGKEQAEIEDVFFKGDSIKQTQCHYAYLRRHSSTRKPWKDKEYDKVRDQLHKITTAIAEKAEQENLAVAVGDLEDVQNQDRGRVLNRKLHRFPHYTFRKLLAYKCKERGIPYIEVDEAYTSQTCYKCGEQGERHKGLFQCGGSEMNADVNGAANIAKRALGKPETRSLLSAGAA